MNKSQDSASQYLLIAHNDKISVLSIKDNF